MIDIMEIKKDICKLMERNAINKYYINDFTSWLIIN